MSSSINNSFAEYQDREWTFFKNYEIKKKSKDPRFGDINIFAHKSNQSVIFSKEIQFSSKDKALERIQEISKDIQMNHVNLLKVLGYSTQT